MERLSAKIDLVPQNNAKSSVRRSTLILSDGSHIYKNFHTPILKVCIFLVALFVIILSYFFWISRKNDYEIKILDTTLENQIEITHLGSKIQVEVKNLKNDKEMEEVAICQLTNSEKAESTIENFWGKQNSVNVESPLDVVNMDAKRSIGVLDFKLTRKFHCLICSTKEINKKNKKITLFKPQLVSGGLMRSELPKQWNDLEPNLVSKNGRVILIVPKPKNHVAKCYIYEAQAQGELKDIINSNELFWQNNSASSYLEVFFESDREYSSKWELQSREIETSSFENKASLIFTCSLVINEQMTSSNQVKFEKSNSHLFLSLELAKTKEIEEL